MTIAIREATLDDRAELRALIELSARTLGRSHYRDEQIEGALRGAFGVDTTLIEDRTYYVAELQQPPGAPMLIGCGGWSRRRTLFGGDTHARRDPALLEPGVHAARIRAFFVHPDFARRGVGRMLLQECESAARAAGFLSFELMGTLSGLKFYQSLGYEPQPQIVHPMGDGAVIEFVPMSKHVA